MLIKHCHYCPPKNEAILQQCNNTTCSNIRLQKNHPSDTPERRSEKLLISHELKLKTKTGKDVDQFNK